MKYDSDEYREFEQGCKAQGKLIDPATAEMWWHWAQVLDPYGVIDDLPKEDYCVGRSYFLRAPNSDVWVSIYDLPEATRDEVWRRIEDGRLQEADDLPWEDEG
jgi:hypothetical protein